MKRRKWLVMGLLVLLALGCATSPPADEAMVDDDYPAERFLRAEAVGITEAEAKRAAMAELAAIFDARVYARTLQQATSWMEAGLGEQFDRQVEQTVHIQTEVQLEGARIGRIWPDDSVGGYRALAVLDRMQAASRWQRELSEARMILDGQVQALDAVKGRLSRLAALNRVTASLVRQAVIESRLSVLNRPALPAVDDYTALIAERERLASTIALFIQLEGNPAPPFVRRLNAQLVADGYLLTPYRDLAAGLITGTISVQPLDLGNPQVRFIRAMADIQLVDVDTDTPIAAFDESLRKGHVDEGEAARRAVAGLAEATALKLARALGTLGLSDN